METPIDGPATIFRNITRFRFQQLMHIEQEGSSRYHGYNPEEEEVHHCHDRLHGHRRFVGTLRPRPRVDLDPPCADHSTGRIADPPPRQHRTSSSKNIPVQASGDIGNSSWSRTETSGRAVGSATHEATSPQTGVPQPKGDPHAAGNQEEQACTYTHNQSTPEFVFRTRLPMYHDAV